MRFIKNDKKLESKSSVLFLGRTCKTVFHDDIIERGSEQSFNLLFDTGCNYWVCIFGSRTVNHRPFAAGALCQILMQVLNML